MAPDHPTTVRRGSGYGATGPARPGAAPSRASPTRPPVRRRVSSRRPIPPLIFLVILAVVALGVWFRVLQTDQAKSRADVDACPTPPRVTAQDPAEIRIRVYNATTTSGLAAQVSAEVAGRGFQVTETANDRTGREVLGVGELRHGARGADKAAFVALFVPGITLVRDTRSDDLLDLVLGPDYSGLAAPEAVTMALATPVAPTDIACTTGDPTRGSTESVDNSGAPAP